MDRAARRRAYFVLMGTSIALIVLAWNLVRLWSVSAAVAMSVVAAVLAPVAVVIGNHGLLAGSREARRDIPPDHPENRG